MKADERTNPSTLAVQYMLLLAVQYNCIFYLSAYLIVIPWTRSSTWNAYRSSTWNAYLNLFAGTHTWTYFNLIPGTHTWTEFLFLERIPVRHPFPSFKYSLLLLRNFWSTSLLLLNSFSFLFLLSYCLLLLLLNSFSILLILVLDSILLIRLLDASTPILDASTPIVDFPFALSMHLLRS